MIGPTPQPEPVAPYRPLPWQVAPWRDRSPVLLLTGAAGGGKSRLAAEKIHGYCLRYPGSMALVTRKVRTAMTKGTILFLKRTIIGEDPQVRHHESKDYFAYANGSILAYAGIEDQAQRERLKSIGLDGAVDIAWMEEANEHEEADYDAVAARLRGKAAPWRQLLLSCNPDAPTHWIKRRLIDGGEAIVYLSSAADNAYNPADYHARLAGLQGVEGMRLAKGLWVKAEGVVYDQWRDAPDGNVSPTAEYEPGAGPIYWFLDDGYSAGSKPFSAGRDEQTGHYVADAHPRVFLLAQLRPTGQLAIFWEDYACLELSDQGIERVAALPYPAPEYVVHGPGSAEIRGRLYDAGLMPHQVVARVEESVKEARRALAPDRNGVRRVLVHPRCVHLRAELNTYAIDPATNQPIKAYDHGPDALRVGLWALRGEQ